MKNSSNVLGSSCCSFFGNVSFMLVSVAGENIRDIAWSQHEGALARPCGMRLNCIILLFR